MAALARQLSAIDGGGTPELHDLVSVMKPMTEKTTEGRKALSRGWSKADPNGNGLCSLAELDSFIKETLTGAHGTEKGEALFALFRPSFIRAYNDAKDYKKDDGTVIAGTEGATQDDFVSKGEFRLFVGYVVIYGAMFDGFSKLDGFGAGREGDDRRVDLAEWLAGYQGLADYNFVGFAGITDDETATAVFQEIDSNGGGYVLLDEYCAYVKNAEITQGTALGAMLAADE